MLLRLFSRVLLSLVACALLLLLALYYFQDKLIFVPNIDGAKDISPYANPPGWRRPSDLNIPYEDVYLETEPGCKIHGWLMKQPNSTERPTIVFFHGNAGNIGHRLPNYAQMYRLLKVNVFAASYRGYGLSQGAPSERTFFHDAKKVIEYLKWNTDIDPNAIITFGRSIGGAVALEAARSMPDDVRAVILENSFFNMKEMTVAIFKPLAYIKIVLDLLIAHRFDNGATIRQLKQPMLFISGEIDEIVPPAQMVQLFDAAVRSTYRVWLSVAQGTHNETWLVQGKAYYKQLGEFIEAVCSDVPQEESVKRIQLGEATQGKVKRAETTTSSEDTPVWEKLSALVSNEYNKKEL